MLGRIATRLQDYTPTTARLPWWRIAAEGAILALILWVLFLPYYSQMTFLDEFDNMIGGNVVAHGGAIYIDFLSQHTPGAYWISALGHLVGAEHFGGQRLFGYAVFAVLLAGLYARNVRRFGRVPMLVVAVLVPMMHWYNPELSYAVLSDNYQAIAVLYLLFEVVAIGVFRLRALTSWITLGLAGAFAVSVAFVSIYVVAGAYIVAALLTILDVRKRLRGVGEWVRFVGMRTLVVVAPYVVVVLVIAATGALGAAYEQAYVLNRTYYSLYLAQGLGSDAIAPLYAGFFEIFFHITGLPTLFSVTETFAVRELMFFLFLAACAILFGRIRPVLGIGLLWMASMSATRGWDGFHAQPLWSFALGLLGLLTWVAIVAWGPSLRPRSIPATIGSVVVAGSIVAATLPYLTGVYAARDTLTTPVVFPAPERSALIETLVPDGGTYGEMSINNAYDFVVTRRMPAGGFAGVVPWFSDALDETMAAKLVEDDPVLIFADDDNDVWGFDVNANAPALMAVIADGYTRIDTTTLGVSGGVYIRNDAVNASLEQINEAFPGSSVSTYREASLSRG